MDGRGLLVANRGEIAIRVMRSAAALGLRSVAVYSEDDAGALHIRRADEALALRGAGAAAYCDAEQILELARRAGCDAVHPGYGFLSEDAAFARRCAGAGIAFVGPGAELLELFGDKLRARALAARCGVPVLAGSEGPTSAEQVRAFLVSLGEGEAVMIKALHGAGGRGMRLVRRPEDVAAAWQRCRSEARASSGSAQVYAERWLPRARHIEVQIVGDGTGAVSHLWERECSVQRRHQKLIEFAPSPGLDPELRGRLLAAALRMAQASRFDNLGTFEFLVDGGEFAFIEANPRLQVEHTVTEQVTGVDLVALQLQRTAGRSLAALGVEQAQIPEARGFAIQLRINTETPGADGSVQPSAGSLTAFEPPSGPGIRVDSHGYPGHAQGSRFDSLLAKLVATSWSGSFDEAVRRARGALREFRIEGVATNVDFLHAILQHPDFAPDRLTTGFVEEHCAELCAAKAPRRLHFDAVPEPAVPVSEPGRQGARVAAADPLAVLEYGKAARPSAGAADASAPGTRAVRADLQGTITSVLVRGGERVRPDQPLFVIEAMKMEHVVAAGSDAIVEQVMVAPGQTVIAGFLLARLRPAERSGAGAAPEPAPDLDRIRPDLAEARSRHAQGQDAARPEAVARRRKTHQRTARENIADLCDSGSFVEYGALVIAAQRRRRSLEDLIQNTPADGLIAGIGSVNGALFSESDARCIALSYDYTVLAGTQGQQNHRKKDRMFELAERWRLPIVFFTEGGGGRPGDTDGLGVAGLDCLAFRDFGRLSGRVPLVGVTSGRCFAGNAALLGCCDVVIATEGSNIGMGGPAMIEGGGLGVFRPEEIGPLAVQVENGVVDLPVADEAEAVRVARQYLSYFQGRLESFEVADQRRLRQFVPENRLRVYDVRDVVGTLADTGSLLELRRGFAPGMLTALARIEGRPIGVIANNPVHLAGAIDSAGADKAARFMQLCDAFDIPLLLLCDTPGIMVGPEAEATALVRHAARMFVVGASLSVPIFTIVLRKSYGLGAQAMAGGSFKAPFFAVSWPTGEFGGMGLEGAVKLGFRKELEAETDPEARRALYQQMVDRMVERGKAVNTASHFEIDDVIDPSDSRRWIAGALRALPPPAAREHKRRPCIDTW